MSKAGYSTYWDCVEGFLKVFYSRLVPDTAEHKSSMLQDLMAGKKTEIDALNGAVIELATKHNIDTPYNRSVHQLLKFMEIGT
jgi:2-dehydropantoate 2-reductase